MSKNELMYKAAQALRQAVDTQKELEAENSLYKDCVKVAFDLAANGTIEDTHSAILNKADELRDDKERLPVIKEAMEMNNKYAPIGKLEKVASLKAGVYDDEVGNAEMEFLADLQEI